MKLWKLGLLAFVIALAFTNCGPNTAGDPDGNSNATESIVQTEPGQEPTTDASPEAKPDDSTPETPGETEPESSCTGDQVRCGDTCVDTQTNVAHCGSCDNACAQGESCKAGKCESPCKDTEVLCGSPAVCTDTQTDKEHCSTCDNTCPKDQACEKGQCVCPNGEVFCDGACVDVQTSQDHCGTCQNTCKNGQVCKAGVCESPCQSGQKLCGTPAACIDTNTNTQHCGDCDQTCQPGEACENGKCALVCPTGQKACGTPAACTDTNTNYQHCGSCGNVCSQDQRCEKGVCVCRTGETLCGGSCINTQTSLTHCGSCNNACSSGQVCDSGKCESTCKAPKQTCSGNCVDPQTDNANCGDCKQACGTGQSCTAGVCACPTGETFCDGQCRNTDKDFDHCGKCNNRCPSGHGCVSGKCVLVCPTGQTGCGGKCVDTKSSLTHCGKCNNPCASGQSCSAGQCQCPSGQALCSGKCVNTSTSTSHCGGCGKTCVTDQKCRSGKCECPAGEALCGGACVNTKTDVAHCGGCSKACSSGQLCINGACSCAPGQTQCSGTCTDTNTDNKNCGTCGQACVDTQTCTSGTCQCPQGQALCGGKCIDTSSSNDHCGQCSNKCSSGQVCNAGKCTTTCASPLTNCNNTCVNPQLDNAHCGGCGKACSGGTSCVAGSCQCPIGMTDCSGTCIVTSSDAKNCGACGKACQTGETCSLGACITACTISSNVATTSTGNHTGNVLPVTLRPDGKVLATGSTDKSIKLWDVSDPAKPTLITTITSSQKGHTAEVHALAFSPDGKTLASGGWDKAIKLWDVSAPKNVKHLKDLAEHTNYILGLAYSRDGKLLASASRDRTIKLWDVSTPSSAPAASLSTLTGHSSNVFDVVFSPDGRTLYSASIDRRLWLWDVTDPKKRVSLGGVRFITSSTSRNYLYKLALSQDGTKLAVSSRNMGSYKTNLRLFDVSDPRKLTARKDLSDHTDWVFGVAFSPDGNTLASGSFDDTIRLWDVSDISKTKSTKVLKGHTNNVWDVAYSPDGKFIYSGSYDKTIKVWGCCPTGQTSCGNACVDLQTSIQHCGACGNVCKSSETCQAGTCKFIEQVTQSGTTLPNSGYALKMASDGNLYVTGDFQGTATFGSTTLSSAGGLDIFVAKMDRDGKWVWATRAGSTGNDRGLAIDIDSKNNVYLTGYYVSTATIGTNTFTSQGGQDLFVAQLDTNGNWKWSLGTGTVGNDLGQGIAVDTNDNVYLAGEFRGTAAFGSTTLTTRGNADILVAKVTTDGKWGWVKQAGSLHEDTARAIDTDSAGNLYISGSFGTQAKFGLLKLVTTIDANHVFVAKMNKDGRWLWAKHSTGPGTDRSLSLTVDSNGNSIVSGYFSSTVEFGTATLTSKGSNDIFVSMLDSSGNWKWIQQAGGTGNDFTNSVSTDSSGNISLTGVFNGTATFGSTTRTTAGKNDIFVSHMDSKGNWLWTQQAGGTDLDYGYGVDTDALGNIFVTGYFRKTATFFGNTTLTSGGGKSNMFVVRLANPGCQSSCASGTVCCQGSCRTLNSDANNCGACGSVCKPGEVCSNGTCGCPSGTTLCGGECVDTQTNNGNCGACGTSCSTGRTCNNGTCGCPSGTAFCGGSTCLDLQTNKQHCGQCNNACSTGNVCFAGACKAVPQVYLQEIHIGDKDFFRLKNGGTTDVNLQGYVIMFDQSTNPYDRQYTFGNITIKGGQSLYFAENSDCPSSSSTCINTKVSIQYAPHVEGVTYLCSAACSSSTVIDVHAWLGTGKLPALQYGAKFTPGPSTGLTSKNVNSKSFVRQNVTGSYPNFYQSDWRVDNKTTP